VTWELFPVDADTLETTATALAQAFDEDPFFRFLAVSDEALRRWLPVAQGANLRITLPEGHTYGLRDPQGAVVGGMCLLPPGTFPTPPGRTWRFLWELLTQPNPWTPTPLRALRRGAPYLDAWEAMHIQAPHWYLYNLGVARPRQGQGAGRTLVAHALELAQQDDLPLYLETQAERNLGFYMRLGFRVIGHRSPHPRGPGTWGLLHGEHTP
jgi:ribosomal protein S18 acetylase RimI-like enzyme